MKSYPSIPIECIETWQNGNRFEAELALNRIFKWCNHRVHLHARDGLRGKVNDPQTDAEDVCNQTFTATHQNRHKFNSNCSLAFWQWLLTFTNNLTENWIRQKYNGSGQVQLMPIGLDYIKSYPNVPITLISTWQNGNGSEAKSAFDEIFKICNNKVFLHAHQPLRDFAVNPQKDADELCVQTFTEAHENRHTFDCSPTFWRWLLTFTNNLTKNWIRKENSWYGHGEVQVTPSEKLELLPEDRTGHPQEIEDLETMQRFEQLIQSLPSPYREIFVLHLQDPKLKTKEIAKILNRRPNTVAKQFKRGVEKLKKRLPHSDLADDLMH
jgi:RNA polymerase sigma factor (sigma-70 family)